MVLVACHTGRVVPQGNSATLCLRHLANPCREGPAWEGLSEAQQRVVELQLRDFVLGGVGLDGAERERFNAIEQELAQLSTTFNNNVLDATKVLYLAAR